MQTVEKTLPSIAAIAATRSSADRRRPRAGLSRLENAIEVGGVARAAVRQQRVAGNRAAALPAEPRVEPLGVRARGVENEQGPGARPRLLFGGAHQGGADAVTAGAIRDHHLGDVGAVRLILRLFEDELNGADDAVAVIGDEENPLAAVAASARP